MYPGGNRSNTNYYTDSHPFTHDSSPAASLDHIDGQDSAAAAASASNSSVLAAGSASSSSWSTEHAAYSNAYSYFHQHLLSYENVPHFNQQQELAEQQRTLHHSPSGQQAQWAAHSYAPSYYPASDHDQRNLMNVMESLNPGQNHGAGLTAFSRQEAELVPPQGLSAMEAQYLYNEQLMLRMQATGVEPRSIYDNLNQAFGHSASSSATAGVRYEETCTPRPRWSPTQEQIQILESIFNSGTTTPSRDMIVDIAAQLRKYGTIAEANVFYWFQNRKARAKRKLQAPHAQPPPSSPTP